MPNTPNFDWEYPTVGASENVWGDILNALALAIDADLKEVEDGAQPLNVRLTSLAGISAASGALEKTGADTLGVYPVTAGGKALANNAGTANTFPYFSASNTVALAAITAAGRAILDDANVAAQRTTLQLGTGNSPTFAGLTITSDISARGNRVMRVNTGTANNSGRVSFGTGAPGTLALGEIYLRHA